MSAHRRQIYFRPNVAQYSQPQHSNAALKFHETLPDYNPTPLIPLDDLARELGITGVYVKHEGDRLGLPSFKILGASWGTFRAIVDKTNLTIDASLPELSNAAKEQSIALFAATDGNHGRAVAFMAKLLQIRAKIYVPASVDEATQALISGEGAEVVATSGSYDDAVQVASRTADSIPGGLLIQDTAFDGYEEIPSWIIEGYTAMLHEIDSQFGERNLRPTMVVTPVGVGSLAQAVVSHYKAPEHRIDVMTVEPDTAACLHKSLRTGKCAPLSTTRTIMNGLDCGTVSSTAWPILREGVDISATISDFEAHDAVQYLKSQGIGAGPCGAASVAALRLLCSARPLDSNTVVVLLCTEGLRPYPTPFDVSTEDPGGISRILQQIYLSNKSSPDTTAPGYTSVANYIAAWLEHRALEKHEIGAVLGSNLGNFDLAGVAQSMVSLLCPKKGVV
ncbi:hypothetical protein AJ79_03032 [Helicocarpus griseus UAMH5409]|uniref:Tryptophan synthase beta chain-like PALP domain-containing protein n=1 Tax=Helicocarpus griseus UAMH5409 TaxID=1447875 RepID=A0A2B7XZE4_9EURO|nr:hypothetical protein AJ79_03032 [Helicocarpus griseus UAMH5409]